MILKSIEESGSRRLQFEYMSQRYCYWSVATGPYSQLMEQCVASARRSGVFKEFHVLTDREIKGCECYDAQTVDMADGMFKLIYLKAGMTKLLFDYFIWMDADSVFVQNPRNVLECLGKSPIHVPLATNLSAKVCQTACSPEDDVAQIEVINPTMPTANATDALSDTPAPLFKLENAAPTLRIPNVAQYVDLMTGAGVQNPVYLSHGAFWIVHREAIDRVIELAREFRTVAVQRGYAINVSACLGYAMQMLCADPVPHRVKARPDLWASDDQNRFVGDFAEKPRWLINDEATGESFEVSPSIIHRPHAVRRFHNPGNGCVKDAPHSLSPSPSVQTGEYAAK